VTLHEVKVEDMEAPNFLSVHFEYICTQF